MATKKAGTEGNGTFEVKVRGTYLVDGKLAVDEDGNAKTKLLVRGVMAGGDAGVVLDSVTAQIEEKPEVAARITDIRITRQDANALKWGE